MAKLQAYACVHGWDDRVRGGVAAVLSFFALPSEYDIMIESGLAWVRILAMTDAALRVSISGLPDTRLAQLTRELAFDLSRAGIDARPVEMSRVPGEKGEPITLGVLALALVTSGTVKAAIECFKSYFSRERRLSMKLTCADGKQVEVTAQNVDTAAVRQALEAAVSSKSG